MLIKLNEYGKARIAAKKIIDSCTSFKIGKTGMNPFEQRLSGPDYSQDYEFTHIEDLFQSEDKERVSKMEASLINSYIDHPKCENKKGGDDSLNDTMTDSDIYTTYIVWK